MQFIHFNQFDDFELLDAGDGYRLERWGNFILKRPDPQAIWPQHLSTSEWQKCDAEFNSRGEKGSWQIHTKIPQFWPVHFRPDIKLLARLTPFKHTGIFAEQAAHWEWFLENLTLQQTRKPLKILNLFGYTGGATIVLTKLGHFVTHVDASKPSINLAKENQTSNKFTQDSIRWILDDAAKFVEREIKRGNFYDGIILDPPAFGHSPDGKTWKFNRDILQLLENCEQLLSPKAKFLILNAYATNASSLMLQNIMQSVFNKRGGHIYSGELCLRESNSFNAGKSLAKNLGNKKDASSKNEDAPNSRLLSTGIFTRWQN